MIPFIKTLKGYYDPLEDVEGLDELKFPTKREKEYQDRGFYYQVAFFGLLIVDMAVVVLWFVHGMDMKRDSTSNLNPLTVLDELRHDFPIVFKPDDRFQNSNSEQKYDDPWQSLMPPGRGFIEIVQPQTSSDDTSIPPSGHYAISMFHQLHCLASLQSAFAALTTNTSSSSGAHSHDHIHGLDHLPHCFDYLRQAIMCAGDTALEEALVVPGLGSEAMPTRNVDGWGTTHLCRDWNTVWEFAAEHRYRNSSGIV